LTDDVVPQDYLPTAVQEGFIATVTEFVWAPWKEAMQQVLDGASQGGSQVLLQTPSTIPLLSSYSAARMSPVILPETLANSRVWHDFVDPNHNQTESNWDYEGEVGRKGKGGPSATKVLGEKRGRGIGNLR
jgi:hypothetical protein